MDFSIIIKLKLFGVWWNPMLHGYFKSHCTTFCIHVTHFFEVKSLSENKAEDTLQIYSGQSEENGLKY